MIRRKERVERVDERLLADPFLRRFRLGQFDDFAVHDVQARERQRAVASQVAVCGVVFSTAISAAESARSNNRHE